MSRAELEEKNLAVLLKKVEGLARALYDGARAGRSKKELLAMMNERLRSLRARCLTCAAEWPVLLLGRDDARHICVVARRCSFVSLRRRLEEHCQRARLQCPSCGVNTENLAAKGAAEIAQVDLDPSRGVADGTARTAIEA